MNIPPLPIRFRRHFRTRAFVGLSLFVILLSCSFTTFYVYDQWQTARDAIQEKGKILVRLLAYNIRLGVFSENAALLGDPIEGIMRESDVLGVAVFNIDGEPLLRETRKKIPGKILESPPGEPHPPFALPGQGNIEIAEEEAVFAFRSPVYAGTGFSPVEETLTGRSNPGVRSIGVVVIVMDKTGMNVRLRLLLIKSFLVMALFLVIGLASSWLLVDEIALSLRALIRAVKTFDETGSMEEISIERQDEIGHLATAFNHLTASLRQREKEKNELESQLRQAQKMEAIGTLSGGIAHDFNNLLTIISGFGDHILRNMPADDPHRSDLEQIAAAANRAAKLTQSLLAFSRKQLFRPQPVNLNDSILRLKQTLLGLIGERINLQVRLSDLDIIIMADPSHVDQVIVNLITNARDAMPNGGDITIITEVVTSISESGPSHAPGIPVPTAKMTVTDTGVGIPESIREKVFDPYYTTKDRGKGTGLGLSIVYGIIKQLGGSIDLESEPGRGTMFRILLPLTPAGVACPREAPPEPPDETVKGTATILLAEDDASVRQMTRKVLEGHGYTVIEAVDGEDALRTFKANASRIQLLLLDVIMPKMNGHQVAEEVRRLAPAINVLFMSGYTSDLIQGGELASSGFHFISKPVSVTALLGAVRKALETQPVDGRLARHG